jgi:hypothetical protein
LAYIAHLLGHPREEFDVLLLASWAGGKQGDADALADMTNGEQAAQSDLTVGRMGDAGEMLDAKLRQPTNGEPQNCVSSLRKRASSISLSWSVAQMLAKPQVNQEVLYGRGGA